MQERRTFLKNISLASAATAISPIVNAMASIQKAKPRLLVRSGWQTVNIGDIGHTFGLLQLIQEHIPEAETFLWIKSYDRGVDELLRKNFPQVTLIKSKLEDKAADLQQAFQQCDMLVHSSGPFVTASADLKAWWEATSKPFGVYGVSLDEVNEDLLQLLNKASFFYCRDTESLRYFKTLGSTCPVQGFAPDATFGIKIYDDPKANAYMAEKGLARGEFICVIPRMRYTPYWQMVNRKPSEGDLEKQRITDAYVERDAEKMRSVITSWVKQTGKKVLICPEVTYQVEFSKRTLYDPLPADIKANCVWRDQFWLPDEATSVYRQSRAMVCCEPHSLIMAVANGIPSIHVKQATDTRKGQMWIDIGLGDWYYRMDETPASEISARLMDLHQHYDEALKKTAKAMDYVRSVQKKTIKSLRS